MRSYVQSLEATPVSPMSPASPDLDMFRQLLTSCGELTGHFPRTVVRILTNLCTVDTGEAATRLASLILLSRLLLNLADTLDCQGIYKLSMYFL